MKAIVCLPLLLLFSTPVFSEVPGPTDGNELSRNIKDQIKVPLNVFRKGKTSAIVDFKFDSTGKPEVVKIHSVNAELKAHIREEFKTMKFDPSQYSTDEVYSITISFRIL